MQKVLCTFTVDLTIFFICISYQSFVVKKKKRKLLGRFEKHVLNVKTTECTPCCAFALHINTVWYILVIFLNVKSIADKTSDLYMQTKLIEYVQK